MKKTTSEFIKNLTNRGLYLDQKKEPAVSAPILFFDDVKTVYIPVSSELCVSVNENVTKGMLLSKEQKPDHIDSFSSVNGKAVAIKRFDCEKFADKDFLEIETDGKPETEKPDAHEIGESDILFAINNCGVLNTTDKTTLKDVYEKYKNGVKNLVIDAVDDEPYVSSKLVMLLNYPTRLEIAADALKRAFGAEKVEIAVYGANGEMSVSIPDKIGKYNVRKIKKTYPVSKVMQSDEETVYIDINAAMSFYCSALYGRSYERTVVTVAGDCVAKPCNVSVPIGTQIGDILNFVGIKKDPKTVILGGSMTGYEVDTLEVPALKSTKAILAFKDNFSCESYSCIGCGRCVDVCPQKLLPFYIYRYYNEHNVEKLQRLSANSCTECGCCSYICPAKIDLRQCVKASRRYLIKEMHGDESSK